MKLLEKDPANRIASAQELARRLRGLGDLGGWSPERAERWWETNLPSLAVQSAAAAPDTLTNPLAAAA